MNDFDSTPAGQHRRMVFLALAVTLCTITACASSPAAEVVHQPWRTDSFPLGIWNRHHHDVSVLMVSHQGMRRVGVVGAVSGEEFNLPRPWTGDEVHFSVRCVFADEGEHSPAIRGKGTERIDLSISSDLTGADVRLR